MAVRVAPDNTAVRGALWRALRVENDSPSRHLHGLDLSRVFLAALLLAAPASADDLGELASGFKKALSGIGAFKSSAAPPPSRVSAIGDWDPHRYVRMPWSGKPAVVDPGGGGPLPFQSEGLRAALKRMGRRYDVYKSGSAGAVKDDAEKLKDDTLAAVDAWQENRKPLEFNERLTLDDKQDYLSVDFYMRQGGAEFNPFPEQTREAEARIKKLVEGPDAKVLQGDLIYEALKATHGNVTLAFGSLAKIFHDHRDWIPKVSDIENRESKAYYRFAGAFIGLHPAIIRIAGAGGSAANIGANPIVYAGGGLATGDVKLKQVFHKLADHAKYQEKAGELKQGLDAAGALRQALRPKY